MKEYDYEYDDWILLSTDFDRSMEGTDNKSKGRK